jgi:3-isopropylmalate/(R)-2-methylmalate dehydratase small subunit
MNAVREVVGRGLPIERDDIDTDSIIPAHWLRRTERTGYAAGLFEAWRRDPAFPLNDPRYAGSSVLLAGANFGCGSSREHAAWALAEHGIRAIIAPSFADIFRANAVGNGLVPVALPRAVVRRIVDAIERDPATEIRVDVDALTVDVASLSLHALFTLSPDMRTRLLEGLDEIEVTLRQDEAIAAYESRRPSWLPRLDRRALVR